MQKLKRMLLLSFGLLALSIAARGQTNIDDRERYQMLVPAGSFIGGIGEYLQNTRWLNYANFGIDFFTDSKRRMTIDNNQIRFYNPTFTLMPTTMTGGNVSVFRFQDPDGSTGPITLEYKDDGSPDLSIRGGRVGINVVDPREMLDVSGNIRAQVIYADRLELIDTANTLFGYGAGRGALRNANFGNGAGFSIDRRAGFNNSNFGYRAGYNIALGTDNTNLGYNAGKNMDGTGNVALGSRSAQNLTDANYSVFLGYNAGSDFSHIGFEGGRNPLAEGKSVFVVNNQAQLHNPLLFGVFVDNTDKDDAGHHTVQGSMAQLAINTHHLVDSCALTVAGAVHVGPKDLDPAKFPTDSLYNDYLLWVERGIVSENFAIVKVDDWSDHVFNDAYALASLKEVEAYVKAHKHLPNVPSEAELKQKGYKMHDMNKMFMAKIEELTLYSIQQEKEMDSLKNDVERLTKLVETLVNSKN